MSTTTPNPMVSPSTESTTTDLEPIMATGPRPVATRPQTVAARVAGARLRVRGPKPEVVHGSTTPQARSGPGTTPPPAHRTRHGLQVPARRTSRAKTLTVNASWIMHIHERSAMCLTANGRSTPAHVSGWGLRILSRRRRPGSTFWSKPRRVGSTGADRTRR